MASRIGLRFEMLQRAAAAGAEMRAARRRPRARRQNFEHGGAAPVGTPRVEPGPHHIARRRQRQENPLAVITRDAVAANADTLDGEDGLGHALFRARIRNSTLPSGPRIGLSVSPSTRQPGCAIEPGGDAFADLAMERGVAHHAAFADAARADLELRLDEGDEARRGAASASAAGSTVSRPMKLASQTMRVGRLGHLLRREVAGVAALAHDDARIVAQLPGELPVPDIDGIDASRAALQQHVGEAAGRGADVEGDGTGGVDAEMVERMGELDAAARHPGMIAPAQFERRFGGDADARLVEPAIAAPHRAGENQRLRLGAAVGKAALDQERIKPQFAAHPAFSAARRFHAGRGTAPENRARRTASGDGRALGAAAEGGERGVDDVAGVEAGLVVLRSGAASWSMKRSGSTIGRSLSP